MRSAFLTLLALCIAGCSADDDGAVAISVIGPKARIVDPNRIGLDSPASVLASALMQGLVTHDASGQIEPALAERWIVTDDGLSFIFRIRRTRWADGKPVTAQAVAASLKASLGPRSRNPLRPLLSNVEDIVAMTDHVVEIRVRVPQPDLLYLLAQPEMAVIARGQGSGPYRIHRTNSNSIVLRTALPDKESEATTSGELLRKSERHVRGERVGLAVARFAAGDVSLVLGGTFDDLPIAQAARLPANQLRRDPVTGLFGLVLSRNNPALANVEVRRALAMAIDRPEILDRADIANWRGMAALLPVPMEGVPVPTLPEWVAFSQDERLGRARAAIAAQMGGEDRELVVRIALPDGPGGRLLFAQVAEDWRKIGVRALRVGAKGAADVRLLDVVAPYQGIVWYLDQLGCARGIVCNAAADALVRTARSSADPALRAEALAKAEEAIVESQTFIPIAAPVRWSLVAPRLQGYRENGAAIHPLNRLMRAPR